MTSTIKKLANGFADFSKRERKKPGKFIRVMPGQKPGADGALPLVVDYERLSAEGMVDDIATMTGPIRERFSGNKELLTTLDELLATLGKLINSPAVSKAAKPTKRKQPVKKFLRVIEEPKPTRQVSGNSFDAIFIDAGRRVQVQKRYGGGS